MHVQAAVKGYDRFVRCIGFGPQAHCVLYDPEAPLHDRYTMQKDFIPAAELEHLRKVTMTINAFFGWEFNSCESLRKDGVWHPIDFANPCPDSQVTSLHYHFPWMVTAYLRWSIFCAATKRKMRKTLDWEPFYAIAAMRSLVRGEARSLRRHRRRALRDRPLRGVLREPPRPPRGRGARVLRDAGGEGRRAQEGRGALPRARGREVHRALLGPHPALEEDRGGREPAAASDAVRWAGRRSTARPVNSWRSTHRRGRSLTRDRGVRVHRRRIGSTGNRCAVPGARPVAGLHDSGIAAESEASAPAGRGNRVGLRRTFL